MIARSVVGRGITGLSRYVLGEGRGAGNDNLAPGEASRVAWIGGQGFGFAIDSRARADLAARVMEFDALNQTSRTRRCEKDAVHLMLAWRVGEAPDRAAMEAAAREALAALGMATAKAVWSAHRDEAHAHLHIVASKIDPDSGRAYNLKSDYLKLSKWAEGYERAHGGIVCLRREEANGLRDAIGRRDEAAVLEAMTRQRATFTVADLERALGKQISGAPARAAFGVAVLAHVDAVPLADAPGGVTTRYTTRGVLTSEARVLEDAARLCADRRHAVSPDARAAVLTQEQFASLRAEQRVAFERATGAEGLALIDGQAGTGKSYTMAAIRAAYEANGQTVIGLAPTHVVAQGMAEDGFRRARTVHSELFALKNGRSAWDGRTVVMVDEAAMIDTRLMAELSGQAAAAGAKLILVGDDRQLASIDRGGMFGALKDRHGAAALTEVTRQHKDEDRRAASMLAEGNFSDALAIYQAKGGLHWTRTQDQARAALVAQWATDSAAAPDRARFVFAYTNADVAQLNEALRTVRRARGELGPDRVVATAEGERAFAAGDRIQFTRTDTARGLSNGAVGTVQAIDGTVLTVRLDSRRGETRRFDAAAFGGFRHGYAGTIYKGQGRTLDQTYLYHSEHWRAAASYVALTRHRETAKLFVATNTARDVAQLARQMARVDDRRAASQFHPQERQAGRAAPEQAAPAPMDDSASRPGDRPQGETVMDQATTAADVKRNDAPPAEPSEEFLAAQAKREGALLRDMAAQDQRLRAFKQQREAEAEAAKKREAENRDRQDAKLRAGDISDAGTRYSIALGQGGGGNVYELLANAALAEGAAFKKEQETLRKQAAGERDPDKRAEIELRRQIEAHEYMAITSQRLAGISATLAGREDSPIAERDRAMAAAHQARANELREERSQRQVAQERQERERMQAQRAAASRGDQVPPGQTRAPAPAAQQPTAADRYRQAAGRGAADRANEVARRQAEETRQREGLRPDQPSETAPPTKEARDMAAREDARAAYQRARSGLTTPGRDSEGDSGRAAGRPSGKGGGRGR